MTKRNNGALAIGIVIVIVAALVAIFTQSRTFAQAMGQGYAPEKRSEERRVGKEGRPRWWPYR